MDHIPPCHSIHILFGCRFRLIVTHIKSKESTTLSLKSLQQRVKNARESGQLLEIGKKYLRAGPRTTFGVLREGLQDERPRTLVDPANASPTHSSQRLNALSLNMISCTTYLEVGIAFGATLQAVDVPFKWGVDPNPRFSLEALTSGLIVSTCTADEFFDSLSPQIRFDLAFLDGLHEWRQTYRDLINAAKSLSPTGLILVDDVIPDDETSAIPDMDIALAAKRANGAADGRWQGDVFRVLIALRRHHPEINFMILQKGDINNAQALVWRHPSSKPWAAHQQVSEAEMRGIDNLSYAQVFAEGSEFQGIFATQSDDAVIPRVLNDSQVSR